MDVFTSVLADHQAAFNTLESLKPAVTLAGESCIKTLKNGGKILICGNGGSAADAQHFSGEIVGRFIKERRGYPAIALTTDSSVITSVGNDYSYDTIFSRQVGAFAKPGDILFGISTSGNSANIANAMTEAKKHGITTIGLLGKDGGSIKDLCDIPIVVPFPKTPRVQECHIIIIHLICAMIDEELA